MDSAVAAQLRMQCLVAALAVAKEQHVFYSVVDDARRYWEFVQGESEKASQTPLQQALAAVPATDDIPF